MQVHFDSTLAPAASVQCLGRNAEEFKSFGAAPFQANWREGKKAGTFETIVYGGQALGTVVLAVATPIKNGSSITMWHRGVPALEIGGLLDAMQRGC